MDADGNGYPDFFAGILTNMIGYDVPEVREAAARSPIVADVRGRGLTFALDLADPTTGAPAPALAAAFMEESKKVGLLAGKGGLHGNVIRMAPPLPLTVEEAEEGLDIIITALERVNATA
ncbi:aminotransferase class III-fold pyridoxal phosphate-dependent enzyme [Spongiactinospora sp. TRM90649]|uniref:aminotransferase class III-fold pyridoxal phosphate-dependent enzyme n=1 Tax=Spongiactinospora sp. TRM90649 TaxID=3031114 RepID=UPI003211B298